MPKTSNEGPTYAGLVDVSPPETVTPEWVPAPADAPAPAPAVEAPADDANGDVSRETKPAPRTRRKG